MKDEVSPLMDGSFEKIKREIIGEHCCAFICFYLTKCNQDV